MNNWREICLKKTDNVEDAITIIDRGALQIALVISDEGHLLGTITDGDIRRALLRHISLTNPITEIMNPYPISVAMNEDKETILAVMEQKALLHIPVVDENNILVGLETLQQLVRKKHYDNPVFLMAGGFGSRLKPMTIDTPKPMLCLGEQPILENIIKRFIDYGFKNFYISIHYLADTIIDYFGDGSRLGIKINYIREEKPLGTAGALGLIPPEMPDLPIIVMNSDILTKINFEHLLHFHNEIDKNTATMCVRSYDFQVPYGVVEIEENSISSIKEKPIHNFFVNAGIYVLQPEVVRGLVIDEYCDMPDLLNRLLAQEKKVSIFPVHEYWLDIGKAEDFVRAKQEYVNYF